MVTVLALYTTTHPSYVDYLYLLAPVSLVILNPFGFVLMEVGRHRTDESAQSKCTTVANIARNISTNPIVLMTTLGIIANLIFNHSLPVVLKGVLNVSSYCFNS